jgi:hypothetical protein
LHRRFRACESSRAAPPTLATRSDSRCGSASRHRLGATRRSSTRRASPTRTTCARSATTSDRSTDQRGRPTETVGTTATRWRSSSSRTRDGGALCRATCCRAGMTMRGIERSGKPFLLVVTFRSSRLRGATARGLLRRRLRRARAAFEMDEWLPPRDKIHPHREIRGIGRDRAGCPTRRKVPARRPGSGTDKATTLFLAQETSLPPGRPALVSAEPLHPNRDFRPHGENAVATCPLPGSARARIGPAPPAFYTAQVPMPLLASGSTGCVAGLPVCFQITASAGPAFLGVGQMRS